MFYVEHDINISPFYHALCPLYFIIIGIKKKQEKVSKQLKMYKGQLQIFSLFGQTHHLGLG